MIKIVYWADYACPYCYVGETRLKKAIDELGIKNQLDIEFKAFELDPDAAQHTTETTVDRFAKKYHLTKQGAADKIEEISSMGRAEGIDFKYATTRNTNTFKAHRLAKLAREKGGQELADKVSELLFNAYFTKNLELADTNTLLDVAEQAGMNRNEVDAFLKTDKYAKEVRQDEQEAITYGAQGVPFFIFGDKFAVPGAVTTEGFKNLLQKLMKESIQIVQTDDAAGQCGPEGCSWVPKSQRDK